MCSYIRMFCCSTHTKCHSSRCHSKWQPSTISCQQACMLVLSHSSSSSRPTAAPRLAMPCRSRHLDGLSRHRSACPHLVAWVRRQVSQALRASAAASAVAAWQELYPAGAAAQPVLARLTCPRAMPSTMPRGIQQVPLVLAGRCRTCQVSPAGVETCRCRARVGRPAAALATWAPMGAGASGQVCLGPMCE